MLPSTRSTQESGRSRCKTVSMRSPRTLRARRSPRCRDSGPPRRRTWSGSEQGKKDTAPAASKSKRPCRRADGGRSERERRAETEGRGGWRGHRSGEPSACRRVFATSAGSVTLSKAGRLGYPCPAAACRYRERFAGIAYYDLLSLQTMPACLRAGEN